MRSFYEFFAGGGMVRAGLGPKWRCLFANDFDLKKGQSYCKNWGDAELKTADVGSLTTEDLPGAADMAWASFPCQDLSLAGNGAGLKGGRSGAFWAFWTLMKSLMKEDRAPQLIVLENVCGTITSHGGKDFATVCGVFQQAGYAVGAIVVNASLFVPQSRPRLFVIGVHESVKLPEGLTAEGPIAPWHTRAVHTAYEKLSPKTKRAWRWWKVPVPPPRKVSFVDVIEDNPTSSTWFTAEKTQHLISMMSPINRSKVEEAKRQGRKMAGGIYKRTRPNKNNRKVQRAEVRFDDISGCLRTPVGGSSRQVVMIVKGRSVKARLISSRETARLMGLPDDYKLPKNYNEAYHLTGDGVVVPVVRHLAKHIFEPVLEAAQTQRTVAIRRRTMQAVKSKNTWPELAVRRLAHRMGYRYRLHRKDLPGKPDLVFPIRRKAIFVHGCFWHQHADPACKMVSRPQSNLDYWLSKLERNVARDAVHQARLVELGWNVLVIWECEVKAGDGLAERIQSFLNSTCSGQPAQVRSNGDAALPRTISGSDYHPALAHAANQAGASRPAHA